MYISYYINMVLKIKKRENNIIEVGEFKLNMETTIKL